MADSDTTPFDALRATFGLRPDDTYIELISSDGITHLTLHLRRTDEPYGQSLAIDVARRVPRVPSVPVIIEKLENGRAKVAAMLPGRMIEADTLGELATLISVMSSVTGFSTPTLALLRQAGGDSEFAGYFRRV